MSHQIKRLRCTVLTAGSAGGNFPSTIDAQSSTWGPAATPAQPGPTVDQAGKAEALAHLKPNPLSRRAPEHYAAASATGFLTGKAAEAGEIMPFGSPVLDRDKRMPFGDRRRGRPTRAILIGWFLGSRPTRGSLRPWEPHGGSIPVRRRLPSAFVDRALKLAGAQRRVGPFEPILLRSVRFVMTPPHKCGRLLGTATVLRNDTHAGRTLDPTAPSEPIRCGRSVRHFAAA